MELLLVIICRLYFLHLYVDVSIPPEFHEEFGAIALIFLDPFRSFMKKVQGLAFRSLRFEHIDLSKKPKKTPLGSIDEHDVTDMTQPSQHLSQPSIVPSQPSSSRPGKMDVQHQGDMK